MSIAQSAGKGDPVGKVAMLTGKVSCKAKAANTFAGIPQTIGSWIP
jgi:hypothetical protein